MVNCIWVIALTCCFCKFIVTAWENSGIAYESPGYDAHFFTKNIGKIACSLKTACKCYFADRSFGFPQHFTAFLDTVLKQIIVRSLSHILIKKFISFTSTYGTGCCNIIHYHFKVIMLMNVPGHLSDNHPWFFGIIMSGNMLNMFFYTGTQRYCLWQ